MHSRFTLPWMLQVTIVLIVCGSLLTFSNASLLASEAAQRPQQNRHGKPRPGKPEGSLPDLEDVQRESRSERQPAPPIPSTIRSPKVPLEPWRRVGDPGTRGELGQAMNRRKRAHASRPLLTAPPVSDDQFTANFFAWALVRTPGGTEPTFWNDQLRVAYAQGQTSLKLAAVELGNTLFESAEYAARQRNDHWYVTMVFKLTKTAEQNWRTLKGHALLAQVIAGVKFKDGLQEGQTRIAA